MKLEKGQIFNDRFKILKEIGRGGFSRVLLVSDTQNGNKEVALKLFADTTGLDTQTIKEVKAEYHRVEGLDHPNILAPYEFGQLEKVPYLVMDYAKGGSLYSKIRNGELLKWNEESKLDIIKEVVMGLEFLHKNKIIHHDLKPENIVIHEGNYKIIDFGLSETKSSIRKSVKTITEEELKERKTDQLKKDEVKIEGYSPGYVSPERYKQLKNYKSPEEYTNNYKVNEKSDIFALGVILFELFEKIAPWGGEGGVVYAKLKQLPNFNNRNQYSSKTYTLIKSCLAFNPEQRPTAKEILDILQKPEPKRMWTYGLVGMIAVIAVGLGIYFGGDWNGNDEGKVVISQDTGKRISTKDIDTSINEAIQSHSIGIDSNNTLNNTEIKEAQPETKNEKSKQIVKIDVTKPPIENEKSKENVTIINNYEEVYGFSEGLAGVNKNGKWGFIDKNGFERIPCIYDDVHSFSEGLAAVKKGEERYFIDKYNVIKIRAPYNDGNLGPFSEGLAKVQINYSDYGYIDKKGNIRIEVDYADDNFSEGIVHVRKDKYTSESVFINTDGKVIMSSPYEQASECTEGLIPVKKDGKWGFINKTGKVLIPFSFDFACSFSQGLSGVKKDDKWGFINKNGDIIIPLIYDGCFSGFYYDLAAVKKNYEWFYINKSNKIVLGPFERAFDFSENLAHVKKDGKWGFINAKGEKVLWPK